MFGSKRVKCSNCKTEFDPQELFCPNPKCRKPLDTKDLGPSPKKGVKGEDPFRDYPKTGRKPEPFSEDDRKNRN